MKLITIVKKFALQAALGLTALTMLAGLALSAPAPVYADATATPTQAANPGYPALVKVYQAEQARLATQAANLTRANSAVTRIQALIAQAQAKSLNVSELQTALATFQSQLASAQAEHNTAASILSAHAGFAGDGNVTNAAEARQTVLDARQALAGAAAILTQAAKDLAQAVRAWRADNRSLAREKSLDKAFAAEQAWLQRQDTNLGKTAAAVDKVQSLIDQWQAKGVDVSFLQALLNDFKAQLTGAQASSQTATTILSGHAGFDANGKVTTLDQALLTVQSAREALRSAATSLSQAFSDLARGLRVWRAQHHPSNTAPAPSPTPAPGA